MSISFFLGNGIVSFLIAIGAVLKVKYEYKQEQVLSNVTVVLVWFAYLYHTMLVILAAWFSPWTFSLPLLIYLPVGLILIGSGTGIIATAIYQFHSFQRMSGQVTDQLITSGIYNRSRNPQNLGWLFGFCGLSLLGTSSIGLLLSAGFFLIIHVYIVQIEEPFLLQMYGKRYQYYTQRTARYWRFRLGN